MRHQNQRHVHGVVQQQILLIFARLIRLSRLAIGQRHHRTSHALHVAQDALDHLLQIGFSLAQILIFHLVKLARDDFELRRQRPLGVVKALGNPVLDADFQTLVLQQHQVYIEHGIELLRCVVRQLFLQALQLLHHCITATAQAVDFSLGLVRFDEIVRYIQPNRADQHRPANRNTARNSRARNRKCHS